MRRTTLRTGVTDVTDVLGLAAIVPASAGACCTVGAWRPGRAVDVVAAVVMVAAMVDGVFGPRMLPGVAWFIVLALLAMALAAVQRFQRGTDGRADPARSGRDGSAHARLGRLHAALGLLVMGATGVGATGGGMTAMPGMAAHASVVVGTWQVVLGGLVAGYLVLTVVLVRDGVRHRSRVLPVVETLAMGIAVGVMSAAML